ncbi:MAG: prepilin-type N-terminal cleavage/methylation domain-containing protein [Chloroflexi bacterium]|nr:prepilin-type N-terminal cleavage/methylation domain-containing protein [Chloroflexota bacterium]
MGSSGGCLRNRPSEQGFNLIELAVVLVIMGLLAAIVSPAVAGFLGKGQTQ